MSGETDLEVSVVSDEDLQLEGSRGSSTPGAEIVLQENGGSRSHNNNSSSFSFDKAALIRPSCNPQYTSFSISSILGRPQSPPSNANNKKLSSEQHQEPQNNLNNHHGSDRRIKCDSPASIRNHSPPPPPMSRIRHHTGGMLLPADRGIACAINAASPASATFANNSEPPNPLMGHQTPTDLAMISRYDECREMIVFFWN